MRISSHMQVIHWYDTHKYLIVWATGQWEAWGRSIQTAGGNVSMQ